MGNVREENENYKMSMLCQGPYYIFKHIIFPLTFTRYYYSCLKNGDPEAQRS